MPHVYEGKRAWCAVFSDLHLCIQLRYTINRCNYLTLPPTSSSVEHFSAKDESAHDLGFYQSAYEAKDHRNVWEVATNTCGQCHCLQKIVRFANRPQVAYKFATTEQNEIKSNYQEEHLKIITTQGISLEKHCTQQSKVSKVVYVITVAPKIISPFCQKWPDF